VVEPATSGAGCRPGHLPSRTPSCPRRRSRMISPAALLDRATAVRATSRRNGKWPARTEQRDRDKTHHRSRRVRPRCSRRGRPVPVAPPFPAGRRHHHQHLKDHRDRSSRFGGGKLRAKGRGKTERGSRVRTAVADRARTSGRSQPAAGAAPNIGASGCGAPCGQQPLQRG
jgi:hypothetical protein